MTRKSERVKRWAMLPSTMWQDITLPVRDARSLTDTVRPSMARRKSDFAVADDRGLTLIRDGKSVGHQVHVNAKDTGALGGLRGRLFKVEDQPQGRESVPQEPVQLHTLRVGAAD